MSIQQAIEIIYNIRERCKLNRFEMQAIDLAISALKTIQDMQNNQ